MTHALVAGRRPAGYVSTVSKTREPGEYFARLAELEEASVEAFRILATELTELHAPGALVRAARRAAKDEERHAQQIGALARRFGTTPLKPHIEHPQARGIVSIAMENAVEGLVRETYGSSVAAFQAERAADKLVKAAMLTIARDEAEHTKLAWDVAAWIEPNLPVEIRPGYTQAVRTAVKELRTEAYTAFPESLRKVAGLPSVRDALALIDQLDRASWSKIGA